MKDQDQSLGEGGKDLSTQTLESPRPAQQTLGVDRVQEIRERWSSFTNFRRDPVITSARRVADIETLLGIIEPVIQSAHALCRQLRAVHNDSQYRTVWEVAQLHRGGYTGLTYTAELAALESAVQSSGYADNDIDPWPDHST